ARQIGLFTRACMTDIVEGRARERVNIFCQASQVARGHQNPPAPETMPWNAGAERTSIDGCAGLNDTKFKQRTEIDMPRLNYGTLLENVVVLESSRLMFDLSPDGARVGFATAFAMPSLTECWCKRVEEANNPWFSYTWLKSLPQRKEAPEGLSQ